MHSWFFADDRLISDHVRLFSHNRSIIDLINKSGFPFFPFTRALSIASNAEGPATVRGSTKMNDAARDLFRAYHYANVSVAMGSLAGTPIFSISRSVRVPAPIIRRIIAPLTPLFSSWCILAALSSLLA